MAWFVYLARCADDTLYCGITNDVDARLAAHNAGKGARYTRARRPIELVLAQRCVGKRHAMRVEYRVKQLTRAQKQALLAAPATFRDVTKPSRRASAR
ncbi:MAG TPA: GIY-YIG nuclease family protein [Kofleriaceae bacterium]|jgi:putative endonuclease|nr:GIY-YIG nuclease family protein [Kofleriaceae bacterium]